LRACNEFRQEDFFWKARRALEASAFGHPNLV
jgi:hypothetical protein